MQKGVEGGRQVQRGEVAAWAKAAWATDRALFKAYARLTGTVSISPVFNRSLQAILLRVYTSRKLLFFSTMHWF
jgi:hypothetical protein